jgi:hypothetical protein
MGIFLNEPISNNLLSATDNKLIAIAVDRTLKVIVLSNQMQKFNTNGNLKTYDSDLFAGTKIAEKKLYPLFNKDPAISLEHYNAIDNLYNLMIESYLNSGGK